MASLATLSDFAQRRHAMVESQLRPNGVQNPELLAALERIPREAFVPPFLQPVAYIDEDLTLESGHILMEPRVFAKLLEAADLQNTDMALLIGAGTAYEAALLDTLVSAVTWLSDAQAIQTLDQTLLFDQGAHTVEALAGGLDSLNRLDTSYDVILIAGALTQAVPPALLDLLNEGGRLLAVLRQNPRSPSTLGQATLYSKQHRGMTVSRLFDAHTPLLPGQVTSDRRFRF